MLHVDTIFSGEEEQSCTAVSAWPTTLDGPACTVVGRNITKDYGRKTPTLGVNVVTLGDTSIIVGAITWEDSVTSVESGHEACTKQNLFYPCDPRYELS